MKDKFTTNDEAAASLQGWALITVFDARGYIAETIIPSRTSSLRSSGDARQFVWDRARNGDALCRRALSIVAASEMVAAVKPKKKARK